jgi:putative glutamine amidotransferase
MKKMVGITCSIDEKKLYLNRDYTQIILNAGIIPLIISPDMVLNYPYIEKIIKNISGLVVSGGGDINPKFYKENNIACKKLVPDERVKAEIKLLKMFRKTSKPVLGICYGMQLINIFLGGTLLQDIQTNIDHTKGVHEIKIIDNPFLSEGIYNVNSSHHQAVKKLGKGLEYFAISNDGIIEGFYLKDHPFFVGVQWHPERDMGNASSLLWQSFFGKINQ